MTVQLRMRKQGLLLFSSSLRHVLGVEPGWPGTHRVAQAVSEFTAGIMGVCQAHLLSLSAKTGRKYFFLVFLYKSTCTLPLCHTQGSLSEVRNQHLREKSSR